jgi:hypothetical protein
VSSLISIHQIDFSSADYEQMVVFPETNLIPEKTKPLDSNRTLIQFVAEDIIGAITQKASLGAG